VLPVDVPFDTAACNLIVSKVKEFNDLNLISNSDLPMIRVVGELDPFYIDKDIMMHNTLVIKGMVHYPFFEDSIQFTHAVAKIRESLCQQTASFKTQSNHVERIYELCSNLVYGKIN